MNDHLSSHEGVIDDPDSVTTDVEGSKKPHQGFKKFLKKLFTQSDSAASTGVSHTEDLTISNRENVTHLTTSAVELNKEWGQNLKKVSGKLGSNEGGWYEKPTGERFYVKFYENPDQGRVEFVANAIYKKLGIKAVRSETIQIDGREAVASPAVSNARFARFESQRGSQDVQGGFVADAYLANWDVIGLDYDNIVEGEDGFYRIDNGGSLIFRARGGDKTYSPDSIPELQSMLIRDYPAGKVFANITEEEIVKQARNLVDKITPNDIIAIVDESGLKGEIRNKTLAGLLGRRELLAKKYGEPESTAEGLDSVETGERRPRSSISEAIKFLMSQELDLSGEKIHPRTEIVCDRDHIEGQRIDIIYRKDDDNKDNDKFEFRFKLRKPTKAIKKMIAKQKKIKKLNQAQATTPNGEALERGKIIYSGGAYKKKDWVLCDALVFKKEEGVSVFVADPTSRNGSSLYVHDIRNNSGYIRSAMGLIKIEVPITMDPEKIEQIIGEIMKKDLGIPDALSEVSAEAERQYKIARYKWQYKIAGGLTPEQMNQAESLVREEVFPGYTTMVEIGKHKEYLDKYGDDVRAVHSLRKHDAKLSIDKLNAHKLNAIESHYAELIYGTFTQGLMSTTERYSRGIMRNGLSSGTDIDSGGADNVFTRIMDSKHRQKLNGAVVIFKPEIFDRTDWYSYDDEKNYGSTDSAYFSRRFSPDEIFAKITNFSSKYQFYNEQMFRTGIGSSYIESIEVEPCFVDGVITKLRSMGLEYFNRKPIEQIIVARQTL